MEKHCCRFAFNIGGEKEFLYREKFYWMLLLENVKTVIVAGERLKIRELGLKGTCNIGNPGYVIICVNSNNERG